MVDIERIDDIIRCRRELASVASRLQGLTRPHDGDPEGLISCYRSLYEDWKKSENTCVLLFVYLYLFDPAALTGQRMRYTLRKRLMDALALRTPQLISFRARNLLFSYRTFPKFRKEVDRLYDEYKKSLI